MTQIIGRILRYGSDPNIIRQIVDFRDVKVSLKLIFRTRKNIYEQKKFSIETIKIKYTDIIIQSIA